MVVQKTILSSSTVTAKLRTIPVKYDYKKYVIKATTIRYKKVTKKGLL